MARKRIKTEAKNCELCGLKFGRRECQDLLSYKRQKWCSQGCYKRSRIPAFGVRYCACCGKQLFPTAEESEEHFSIKRFCSSTCAVRSRPVSRSTKYRNGELSHRRIMEKVLGRKLGRMEFVHHKNGDGTDNRLENLEIMSPATHAQEHNQKYPVGKMCAVCGENFTPHKTKRKRQQVCGKAECKRRIMQDHCRNKRLSDLDLQSIRKRRLSKEKLSVIACDYGIAQTTVSMICLRRYPYNER